MSNRVTIKSIARDLGISHMTVSRALSNHPNVQKETRETIVNRAHELGYVKSAAATAMRGGGTRIVGLLLPNIVNEFYARSANTMAVACEEQSYQLIVHLTNDRIELENKSLERLREIQARAVVMVPAPLGDEGPGLQQSDMKIIQLIRQRELPAGGEAILVDDRQAIRDAVVHLAGLGHTSIAYIGADAALSSGRDRLAAYRQGLVDTGQECDDELVRVSSPSFEMGRQSANEILDQGIASAIICGGFEISNGALSALMAHGLQPSGDFAFIGYGDPTFYSWIDGGISTICVPVEGLAFRAAELIENSPTGRADDPVGATKFAAELKIRV